jgi:AmmeMemoRadiSam system protein A
MPDLSSNNRKKLLEMAREAIRVYLETGDHAEFGVADPQLQIKRGCFVTLKKGKDLRGCIGTFDSQHPLNENIPRMAVAAAFQDNRFSPVGKQELDQIRIEISVLGPLEKISSIDEIELGRHGILIRSGNRSGTFLPDVAIEHKMSREEFVMICAREKAGLDPKDIARAELFRYEVEKFSE